MKRRYVQLTINFFFLLIFASGILFAFIYLKRDIKKVRRSQKHYKFFMKKIENNIDITMPVLGNLTMPLRLQNIPLAESEGIVLQTKKINIRNVVSPYNASIIKEDDHYLIFFRYDVIDIKIKNQGFKSFIGVAKFDKDFNQIGDHQIIDTNSEYSEDPRIFKVNDDLYVSYNDIIPDTDNCRSIYIAKLAKNLKTEFITDLDFNLQAVEKNWVPFEYDDNGKKKIYFEYYINPHKIFELKNPKKNSIVNLRIPKRVSNQRLFWPEYWGIIRGGTPAKKINENEYLAFFHTSFCDKNGFFWYLMGVYTFEAKPPFKITRISNYPILFNNIYDSIHSNTADPKKRVIFPCGFVVEKKDGRELIHVSCGENDSSIKIITMDKEKLFKSLKKL